MTGPRVWAGMALLFVFSLGAFTGVFYERHHASPRTPDLTATELHETAMAELVEVLDLDDDQLEKIHAVLADRQQLVQDVWEQVRPEVAAAMQEIHTEIGNLLRPEQRQRYHEWLNHQRAESGEERVLIIPH